MNTETRKKIADFFQRSETLTGLLAAIRAKKSAFWLVGGCLRDLLLDRPVSDIDIVTPTDPTAFAKAWAAEVRGRWFWLDAERLQSRVILGNQFQVDFSPLRAESIIRDLELRDFTINSLALPLHVELARAELLDPLGGRIDLFQQRLCESSPLSFQDDPLRMIKGVRHAVTLDFHFSSTTSASIKKHSDGITFVAGERIREELLKILLSEAPLRGLELLYDNLLLHALLGPPGAALNWSDVRSQLQVFQRKLMDLDNINRSGDFQVESLPPTVLFLLLKFLQFYQPRQLTDLLHHRLRFSRCEQQLVEQLISQEDSTARIFMLFNAHQSRRVKALIVELLTPFPLEKMLYWGVCHNRLNYEQIVDVYHAFQAEQKLGRVPDLIGGRKLAIMAEKLSGPGIGLWQKQLKYAEINGEISTVQEAEEWLKGKLLFDKKEV